MIKKVILYLVLLIFLSFSAYYLYNNFYLHDKPSNTEMTRVMISLVTEDGYYSKGDDYTTAYIKQLTDSFLSTLPPEAYEVNARYDNLPFLALSVNQDLYQQLKKDKRVEEISEDSEVSIFPTEPPKIPDNETVCYTLYAPVCGDDGITYSNDCNARVAGVQKWTEGACKEASIFPILIQKCPTAWYDNQMPSIDLPGIDNENQNNQYFIIDEQRYEPYQVDIDWVKNNCEVKKPQFVF